MQVRGLFSGFTAAPSGCVCQRRNSGMCSLNKRARGGGGGGSVSVFWGGRRRPPPDEGSFFSFFFFPKFLLCVSALESAERFMGLVTRKNDICWSDESREREGRRSEQVGGRTGSLWGCRSSSNNDTPLRVIKWGSWLDRLSDQVTCSVSFQTTVSECGPEAKGGRHALPFWSVKPWKPSCDAFEPTAGKNWAGLPCHPAMKTKIVIIPLFCPTKENLQKRRFCYPLVRLPRCSIT